MSKYELLNMGDSQKWKAYLEQLPIENQDIYYTPEYYKLYEELGDGKEYCFVFISGNEIVLYPFLINSVNKLGYTLDQEYFDIQGAYGYNGVVSTTLEKSFIEEFYQEFNSYCHNKNIIAEFTRFHPLLENVKFSKNRMDISFDRETVYIDLKNSFERIFSQFQATTRKQIRRATNRHLIRVKIYEKDISILDTFYDIYIETMKRNDAGQYLYFNRQYFKSIIENTSSCCFIAYAKEKPIAAIIIFYNKFYIQGHLGGALTNYLFMAPFSFLYQEIIKFGQKIGCRYFHIGGGTDNTRDNSLLKFKGNFAKERGKFFIGKKIHNHKIYDEVIKQWEEKNPKHNEISKNILLRYRNL